MCKTIIHKIDSNEIIYLRKQDKILSNVIDKIGDLKYELYEDSYSFLVFTIIGQMLSNEIGEVLYSRLEKMCDGNVSQQSVVKLSDASFLSIGISKRKINAIKSLTKKFLEDDSFLSNLDSKTDKTIIDEICSIHGVGPWTAKMFLIFVLDRPNVLPFEDGAFVAGYSKLYGCDDNTRDKKVIRFQCERWEPYSSLAVRYIYKIYDSELKLL